MDLRKAGAADLRPLAELWTHAFPGRRTVADRIRQLEAGVPYGGLESSWLVEERGRIAGAFRAYSLTQHLAGSRLPMLGLAGVATSPGARRRGVGRALCRGALRIGRERGDLVCVLYPFRPDYYGALGWGLVGELHAHRFPPAALPDAPGADAVRMAEAEDREAIAACYARRAARSNGPIDRSPAVWSYHLDPPGVQAVVFDAGGVRGYALVRFGRAAAPGAGTLHVLELVAEDDEAYRALLGWIARQRDQFAAVRYDARPDERLDLRLGDPRPPGFRPFRGLWFPTARRIRGPMLRLLDVAGALAARTRWGMGPHPATLRIEVEDAEIPENRGPWDLTLGEGGARVRAGSGSARVRAASGGADASLRTDIATFSQIYAGELAPSVAARLGRARIDGDAEAVDRAFHLPDPFCLLDEF